MDSNAGGRCPHSLPPTIIIVFSNKTLSNNHFVKNYLSHNKQIGHVGAVRLISALQDDNKTLATFRLPAECEPIEYGSL